MRKLLLIGAIASSSIFALPIDETLKIWNEAYIQGYEDGKKAGLLQAKEMCLYLEGAKVFDDLLINGVIPPPKIKAKWIQVSNSQGLGYKRELTVEFQPVSMEQLENYKEFAEYIDKLASEQDKDLPLGYYYVAVENPLPLAYKGLLGYLVKKFIGKDFAIGVEKDGKFYIAKAKTLEDAKFIKAELERILHKNFRNRIKAELTIEKR
jgi:hypothetical protein